MMSSRRLTLALAVLMSSLATAQDVPQAIAFTGRVADNGALLNGTFDLNFKIFDAATGGNRVWEENRQSSTLSQGLVDVQLGNVVPLTPAIFSGAPMYLEVTVGTTVLAPRTAIVSAPYAIRASVANTAATLGTLRPGDVQQRVTGTCPSGSAMSAVGPGGAVSCQPVATGTVTGVTAGAGLTGGTITSSGTIGLASSVQNWASQPSCAPGRFMSSIASNGTATCSPDTLGVTSIATGAGLVGGPITSTGSIDIASTVPNWLAQTPACTGSAAMSALARDGTTTCSTFLSAPALHGGLGYAYISGAGVVQTSFSYNSSGGSIVATRNAAGTYTVVFNGLAPPAAPYGHFQVTGYSSGTAVNCILGASNFSAATAQVLCYAISNGALTDSFFDILWLQ